MQISKINGLGKALILSWLLISIGVLIHPDLETHAALLWIGGVTASIGLMQILVGWGESRKGKPVGIVEILMLIFVLPNIILAAIVAVGAVSGS